LRGWINLPAIPKNEGQLVGPFHYLRQVPFTPGIARKHFRAKILVAQAFYLTFAAPKQKTIGVIS
jgi:hypothetical protein